MLIKWKVTMQDIHTSNEDCLFCSLKQPKKKIHKQNQVWKNSDPQNYIGCCSLNSVVSEFQSWGFLKRYIVLSLQICTSTWDACLKLSTFIATRLYINKIKCFRSTVQNSSLFVKEALKIVSDVYQSTDLTD